MKKLIVLLTFSLVAIFGVGRFNLGETGAMRFLGFDARDIMKRCIASIDAQRAGMPYATAETIAALFEEEVAPA